MKKILAIALLSFAITACESNPTENSNAAIPNTNTAPAATPASATPTPELSSSSKMELKAGDKVKVTINGAGSEAPSSVWTKKPERQP